MALRSMAECPKIDLAVGGDRLSRPHDEPVTDLQLRDREPALHVRGVEHGHVLGPDRRQRAQRVPRPTLGQRLEIPSGQEEGGHAGGHVDVDGPARLVGEDEENRYAAHGSVSRQNMAYTDQPVAATMPSETRVSMVDVRCRALRIAAV